jgi:succinylarginine dihydrolase
MADMLYSAYLTAKSLVQQWNSQSVSAVIPNDATVIADGSAADGRAQITDAQATNIITRAIELINWMERGTLDTSGTQNNATLNTVGAVEVNGTARF